MFITKANHEFKTKALRDRLAELETSNNALIQRISDLEKIVMLDSPRVSDVTFRIILKIMDKLTAAGITNFERLEVGHLFIRFFGFTENNRVVFYFKCNDIAEWTGSYTNKDNYIFFDDSTKLLESYLSGELFTEIDKWLVAREEIKDKATLDLKLGK